MIQELEDQTVTDFIFLVNVDVPAKDPNVEDENS